MLEKGFSVPELLNPALPQPASWWPLPPGWTALGAVLLAAVGIFLILRLARWRRNLWRRQALQQLGQPHSVDGWMALIKRIQLIHLSRKEVSGRLTPQALLQDVPIDAEIRQLLSERYCQPDNALSDRHNSQLQQQLSRWLRGLPHV